MKRKQNKKNRKDFYELERIIALERTEKLRQKVADYIKNFEFVIPSEYDYLPYECAFLRMTVRTLSPLINPIYLAEFLEIDSHLVYDALEDGVLPHFTDGHKCYVKTVCILPFLRKHSII